MALITTEGRKELIALHVAMTKVAPSSDRLSEMVQLVENGATLFEVAAELAKDAFFKTAYPGLLTGEEFANSMADTLLASDIIDGARDWAVDWVMGQLAAGAPRSDIFAAAVQALGANTNPDFASSATKVENMVAVAEHYAVTRGQNSSDYNTLKDVLNGVTEDPDSVDDAKAVIDGDAEAATGKTFQLTIGENSGTAFTGTTGNDVFEAPVAQDNNAAPVNTLEDFDSLNGGDGNDTLRATLHNKDAAPVLTNIENVEVRFTDAKTMSLANTSGVSSVTVQASTAAGTVSKVGSISNFAVRNQNQDVTVADNTGKTLNLTVDTVGKSTALNTLTFADKATTLNVTANNGHVKTATLAAVETLTIAATGKNTLDLTSIQANAKTATITGTGSVDISAATMKVMTTLTATGNSGGVTAKFNDDAVKVNTGSGKDSITYDEALVATTEINLGDGNDTLTIAGISAAGAKANGGAGTDTLGVTDGSFLNADAAKVYTGFETLGIAGGTGKYNMENLPGLTAVSLVSTALTGDVVIENAVAGTSLTISSKAGTDFAVGKNIEYQLKDSSGKSDAATLTLAASDSSTTLNGVANGVITLPAFKADGIETLTVASNISNVDPLLTGGDYTNTITALSAADVTTLNVTGGANLTIGAITAGALTKINASASTGGLSVNVSAITQSVEFLGGQGEDTYTSTKAGDTINTGKGMDTINLDAGNTASDTLIFAAGDSVLNSDADGHDVINNFGTANLGGSAMDQIDLGAFGFTGQQSSAFANKGALAASVVDGSVLTQADFFSSGGADRAVAVGTNGGSTYVFIDVNKDGDFNAADDLFLELVGVTDISNANFGY